MLARSVSRRFWRQLGRVRDQVVERSVLADEFLRAFFADARNALDVVDRVAHQRHHVDHLTRLDAELLEDAGRVVPCALVAGIEHAHAVAHELEEVLVHRDDGDVEPSGHRRLDQRPDHVVGLVAIGGENRDAERFAGGVHHRYLARQLVGHRGAVGLVVGHEIVAERPARQVERRGDEFRFVLPQEHPEHRHEDVDGVGGLALRVVQQRAVARPDGRVVRAVHLRAAVDEVEQRSGGHWQELRTENLEVRSQKLEVRTEDAPLHFFTLTFPL